MQVTGELDPDVTEDYIRGPNFDTHGTWTHPLDPWTLWYNSTAEAYYISPTAGVVPEAGEPYWIHTAGGTSPVGDYTPQEIATGTATVTST